MDLEFTHFANGALRVQSTQADASQGPTVAPAPPIIPYGTFTPLYREEPVPQLPQSDKALALARVTECKEVLAICEQAGFRERLSSDWKRLHRTCLLKVAEAEYDAMKYTDPEAWAEVEATLDPGKAIERSKS